MSNAAQPNRWEMTQKERETFERASLKTYSNVKERSIPQRSNFSWEMSAEEKEVLDRTLGEFRTKNEAEGVQLATSAQQLRSSILTDLQSDRYAGQEERLQLQKDIYSYDNMLRQMSLYGYDISDARNSVAAIQDVANSRGKFFRQFKNEDEYIISVPEVRMKKYAENKQRIEEGLGSDEELEELTAWNNQYERFYKVLDDYGVYTQNADFDTVSRNRNFANPARQDYEDYHRRMDSRNYTIDDQGDMWYRGEKIDDAFFEKYQEPVTADKLGIYLSASEDDINDAMNAFSEGNVSGYDKLLHDGEGAHWELLSEDEVDIYYYLMNTQGKNAAYQYLDDMQVTLDRRYTINDEKSHEDDSAPERIFYSIASVPESILGGIGAFLSDAAAYVDGEEINPYDGAHYMLNSAAAIRETTAEAIDNATGGASFLGISLGDVYQAGMSGADSFAGAYLLGGTGYGAVMGMGAASSEARKLYEAGASREQIAQGALLAGAAEMVFEKISIEHFVHLGNAKNIAAVITNTLKQGGIEASEEIATELANTITNKIVMGSQSDFDQGVKKLMEQEGLTYAQAAAMYVGHNAWKAGAGGFISGSMLGGTRSAVSYAGTQLDIAREGKRILNEGGYDKLRTIAEELAEKTAGKEAAKLGEYIAKADKKTTARNVGRVSNQLETVRQEQNRLYVRNILIENGMDERQANKTTESFLRAFETERLEKMISEGSADKLLNNSAVLAVLDKVASLEEKSVNTRNQKHQLAMLGIKVNQDGAVDRKSLADAIFTAALLSPQTSIAAGSQQTDSHNATAYHDNGLIYNALISLGVHKAAAESLAKSYDPAEGISPEIYARGAAEAFFYGRGNFTETELRNGKGLSPVLTELQRSTAYRLGQIFQERQTTKEEAAIAQKKAAAKKSGSVAQSQKGNVYYDGDRSRLTERQRVSVRALEKLAQALGVDFYLYESERDAAGKPIGANGWYDQKTGDIHIDLNAGELGEGTILFTAAHELTHFLRQWSPSKFKVLSDFLVGQYGAKGQSVSDLVRNQQAKAKRNGRSLSWMQAYEEMVADSMETMLSDGTVIEKLTKLSAKDKGLAQKVLDWFKGFAAKLKRAYKDLSADSAEGRLVAEMTDTIDRLQTLFTEGLAQAGENYRAAERRKNSTSRNEHAEKHYSFRNSKTGMANDALQPYDAELRNLIESQGNIIVDSYEKLVEVVNRAFDNPKDKATAYFGILDTSILVRIEKSIQNLPEALKGMLFKQNKQYSVATTLDSIRHLTDNKSISRNDVMDYLDRLADTIAEFDTVAFDNYTDGMGKRNNGILFKKLFSDGVLQSFSIVSHKKRSIRLVTIYLESGAYQKKKSAKTLPMQNAPAHTLKAGVGQTSTNSISQLPQKNNLQNSTSSNNTSSFSELHSDRGNLTTRSVLMEMDTKQVKNDIAQKYLKMYQENVQLQYAEQKKLVDLQEKLDALPVDQRNTDRAHDLRNEANKVKNHIRVYESILTRLETDSPLTYLIAHEVEPRLAKAQETAMPQERETLHGGEQAASQPPEMEVFYRVWSKSIGINDAVKTLAEYYDVKYNDSARYELLESYIYSVANGRMSPMAHFDLYEEYHRRIQEEIVGKNVNGIQIMGQTKHFLERVFGTMYDPKTGLPRSGVSIEGIRDCIENPVNILPVKEDETGRLSFTVEGNTAKVSINIDTGLLIQTNPWSVKND